MKHNKFAKMLAVVLLLVFSTNALVACNIEKYFVFGGIVADEGDTTINPNIETFEEQRTQSSSPCITTTVMRASTLQTSGWA